MTTLPFCSFLNGAIQAFQDVINAIFGLFSFITPWIYDYQIGSIAGCNISPV
jgi:hypothetical protein